MASSLRSNASWSGAVLAAADDRLADHRHRVEHRLAEPVGVGRHVAPADQRLAFLGDEPLEMGDGEFARRLVLRQEAHRDGIVAGRRQRSGRRAPAQSRNSASGIWIRMPAPSPSSGSAPTAPRWSRLARISSAAADDRMALLRP